MYSGLEQQDQNQLVEQYLPLVRRIAWHLVARLPPEINIDDLIQAGLLGLLDAIRQYDASLGAKFETYATIRVRGAILDEVRRNDWVPKSVHKKARDVASVMQEIMRETGRDPQDNEIAERLQISLTEYYHILQDASNRRILNFEELAYKDEDNTDIDSSAYLEDKNATVVKQLISEELKRNLASAIKQLPEREKLTVSLYYDAELNLKEIGAVLNVSESRVSQILSQAQLRLKARLQQDNKKYDTSRQI